MQPSAVDPPARLGDWLTAAGASLEIVTPFERALPGGLDDYQGVVCLGGGMGVFDDADHPWLADLRQMLATAVSRRVPTLAVCLGAQLLAAAIGGRVVRGDVGPEVGPGLVAKRDAAWRDPLFADLPFMPDVLQFHEDVIATLPPATELLASSVHYAHQAFRVGPVAYGLQFHIETTPDMVLSWARHPDSLADHARPGALAPDRLVEVHADIEQTWRPFAERFVRLVAGELTPATPANLPLA